MIDAILPSIQSFYVLFYHNFFIKTWRLMMHNEFTAIVEKDED